METLLEHAAVFDGSRFLGPDLSILCDACGVVAVGQDLEVEGRGGGRNVTRQDLEGRLVTPALIDCHTHLVFGGDRSGEFAERLRGTSYQDIMARGGGIMSTVRATRAAGDQELADGAWARLEQLHAQGVGTVEIKSGYGLGVEEELRMLRLMRELPAMYPGNRPHIVRTFLGAHAIPPDVGREEYVGLVTHGMIPLVAAERLAAFCDVFCEKGAFTLEETRRIFEASKAAGLGIKCHAEQLSHTGAAKLAAEFGAVSCDHLEYLDDDGVLAMKAAGTVAVLLPGAMLTLGLPCPPVAKLRAAGVPMAVATDCNPGSSMTTNLHLMMQLACLTMRLTPEEALAGVTAHAARALGLQDRRGRIAPGYPADFCVWDCRTVEGAAYELGGTAGARRLRLEGSP